jgi:prolipoprotein diacylglyceryltransferase
MKKVLFSALLAFAFTLGNASNAELFSVNEQELNTEFAQLNELEAFVEANEGITASEINAENPLVANLETSGDVLGALASFGGEPPLGIPSFLWGFCFNVAGVALVYFVADDRDETKKALIGCAVSAGLYLVWWIVWVLLIGNSFLFF